MKLIGCVLLIISTQELVSSYSTHALDYILRTIDHLQSVHGGVFSCIFWDISNDEQITRGSLLEAVMRSDQLSHVTKYVVRGVYPDMMESLPCDPSLVLMHPGDDVAYLEHGKTEEKLSESLSVFEPKTKLLILANFGISRLVTILREQIYGVMFKYFVIMDIQSTSVLQCNSVWDFRWPRAPQPMYVFTWQHRYMRDRNISYAIQNDETFSWNERWVEETARYLQTEAVKYIHNCRHLGKKCLNKARGTQAPWEILLEFVEITEFIPGYFDIVCTSIPQFMEIATPRDRQLNVAELLVMPFNWRVWTLFIAILIAAETAKHLYPKLFKNNPTLLVVCGYERHSLHQADRLEKFVFISLIVLMFFMSNAFETKIVSLMVSKPDIFRIRTLDDLSKSNLKFYFDLENSPEMVENPLIGNMIVHSSHPDEQIFAPGAAFVWMSEFVELWLLLTYDFDRSQPFYTMLEEKLFNCHECYITRDRFPFLDVLTDMHLKLDEAGLIDMWKEQWKADILVRQRSLVRLNRTVSYDGNVLKFNDLKPMWMILVVGLGASGAIFVAEILKKMIYRIACRNYN